MATFDWTAKVDVPIAYTTDSGRAVTCTAVIKTGAAVDADARTLKNELNAHDWTGVGQLIYDRALANPSSGSAGESVTPTSSELGLQS